MMLWSFVLSVIGIIGLLLTGSKLKIGWVIGFLAQCLWLAYALVSHQWGFIFSALAYGFVYARNWWKWYLEDTAEEVR